MPNREMENGSMFIIVPIYGDTTRTVTPFFEGFKTREAAQAYIDRVFLAVADHYSVKEIPLVVSSDAIICEFDYSDAVSRITQRLA